MKILRLDNPVQRYSWGSTDGFEKLLGMPNPSGSPAAELLMGAHPKAPSSVVEGSRRVRLDEYIAADPEAILGPAVADRFDRSLPFLFKVLSAARPLSIQAHPAKLKAERGYEREELAGIPRDAAERSYRDRNHKPEQAVALTRFEGLCGFRPVAEIVENFRLVEPGGQGRMLERLERNPGRAELSVFFYALMSTDPSALKEILGQARGSVAALLAEGRLPAGRAEAFRWVLRLMDLYPGDIGALMPLILNHVVMEPGEGIFIAPGELHAYLGGTAIEIMANSDNVIRGALTDKHIDLPELVSVLSFVPEQARPAPPPPPLDGEERFPILAPDFELSRIGLQPGMRLERESSGPEILLATRGRLSLDHEGGRLELRRGEAAFIRADAGNWSIEGEGQAYRASVPESV
jgi:mannose-6-phosphate isomerase